MENKRTFYCADPERFTLCRCVSCRLVGHDDYVCNSEKTCSHKKKHKIKEVISSEIICAKKKNIVGKIFRSMVKRVVNAFFRYE